MYADPQIAALVAKLNQEGPAALKNRYYIGDPIVVAESALPICFISKDTVAISPDTNMDDKSISNIVLNVVTKFSQSLNNRSMVQAGTRELYQLCEERNDDYSLKPGSIAYVLRKYEVIDGANDLHIDTETELTIDYVISPPERRGIFSTEAMIRTSIWQSSRNPGIAA